MDRHDDAEANRALETSPGEGETHANTGGAVAAGAVTGGVIGLTGGPVGAAIGAVGGALVAAAAERMMHSDDDSERARAELRRTSESPVHADPVPPEAAEHDLKAEPPPG